jgi:hypothetical protein
MLVSRNEVTGAQASSLAASNRYGCTLLDLKVDAAAGRSRIAIV